MTAASISDPAAAVAPMLLLDNVSCTFGAIHVLTGLTLSVAEGEFVAVVGPSGCGKTTLLGILSGTIRPGTGVIRRRGRSRTVHQSDGLFPWCTVEENVRLGLRELTDRAEVDRQVKALLRRIGLEGFADHYPHQLSGGMRQRVEIARALAGETETLLLDEPFSALDYLTRLRMRSELAGLLAERPRTVVLVTHDIEEAAQLADRIVVLTDRPAAIRCELRLSAPRPRSVTDPAVVHAVQCVLAEIAGDQSDAEYTDRPETQLSAS